MEDFRLIEILKTFDREEFKSFEKFLESPFVKSRRNLHSVLEGLMFYHPNFSSPSLNKESVFKKIFPNEDFNDKKLMNLIFDLTKAAEDYMIHKILEEDRSECLLFLSKAFYERKLSDNSMKVLNTLEKSLKPGLSTENDYYEKMRSIDTLKIAYYTENNEFDELVNAKRRIFESSATRFIMDTIEFLSIKKPVLDTHGINVESKFTEAVVKSFNIDLLVKLIENNHSTGVVSITLQYYKLKTIEEPENTEHYYTMRDYFYNNLSSFDREEKCILFNHLAGYCVNQFTQFGKKKFDEFKKEGLEVYKKMLESSAYSVSESEYMQPLMYRNIYQFCNSNREIEWFKYFIDNYSVTLNPDLKEELSNLAYAYYYFIIKEYESSLERISKINHEFFLFKTDVKNPLLRLYYELDYIEQAYSMVDSYKHFLSKSKELPEYHKTAMRKFLKLYVSLLKIKSNPGKEEASFLNEQILKDDKISSKNWLLEKAGELIGKRKK